MKKYFWLLCLIAAFVSSSCGDSKKDSKIVSDYSPSSERTKPHFSYDETYYADGDVCGAYNEDDLKTMLKYIRRNDKKSFDEMRYLGFLVDIKNGTPMQFVDIGISRSLVRLENGQKVWIANEFVTSVRTVSENAEYHDAEDGSRTSRYAGSAEQQRDLELIDEYLKNHPED